MPVNNETVLSITDLKYTYPSSGKQALSSVTLALRRGEYVALLGANGSGKSTLARCIAGLLEPNGGSVQVAPAVGPFRVPVGTVFQSPADQIVAETVELDVAFGPENLGLERETMRTVVGSAIGSFGLSGMDTAPTGSLPSGRKQHLALASVDALSPALLLLDEPTSMLSESMRGSFLDYLDDLSDGGVTILHVTHDLDEALRAGRAIVLDDGKVAFDGLPADLAALTPDELHRLGLAGRNAVSATDSNAASGAAIMAGSPRDSLLDRPALSCENLSFGPVCALSLDVYPGTVTAIAGESGSGKTLLLELLAGLRTPEAGSVMAFGGKSPRESVALAVQDSEASLFAEFVADDVAWGPKNKGLSGEALKERTRTAMEMAGLPFETFADRRTFSLSGGERRKAALAGIIALDTPVVLLDEPFSALDARSRAQLALVIGRLRDAGKAVVFTATRDAERRLADRVIELIPSPREESPAGLQPDSRNRNRVRGGVPVDRELRSLERLRAGETGADPVKDSAVRRLSPLAKFVCAISFLASAVAVKGLPALLCVAFFLIVPVAGAKLDLRRFFGGILRILPWLAALALLQYAFLPDPAYAIEFFLRFIALYSILSVFSAVTPHTEIRYGMEDLFGPFARLGMPTRDLSLVVGIVFRFMSLLYGEAARIVTARLIRSGGSARKKGLMAVLGSAAALFVPLMLRTLVRAERLAEAIHARYYGAGENSRFLLWNSGIGEIILMIAAPLVSASLIIASRVYGK